MLLLSNHEVPFDLRLAKLAWEPTPTDSGFRYQLFDSLGRKARIVCDNRKDNDYPLVVLVQISDNYEEVATYTKSGGYNTAHNSVCDLRLRAVFSPES